MPEKIRVYTTKDKEWNAYVDAASAPDIYFRSEYSRIYEEKYTPAVDALFGGEAQLFVMGDKKEFAAMPFLKRTIPETEFYDMASPYGYSGPLVKTAPENEKVLVKKFHEAFATYASENKIVTAFMRLNPVVKNYLWEENGEKINNTVVVDLAKDEQTLLAEMDKKARTAMRKAQREGVVVSAVPWKKGQVRDDAARDLTLLYTASMRKKNAGAHYFFPLHFFENTLNMLGEHAIVFIARHRDTPIGAAIFMYQYGNMHYHFSGIDPEYHLLYPTNLLLFEAVRCGRKNGCRVLHLGGGTTNSDNDSLFKFKASFARGRSEYYVKKIIFDKKKYDELTEKRKAELQKHGKEPKQAFFPAYRG